MLNKAIKNILRDEDQVIFLKKKSEPSFIDTFIFGFFAYLLKGNAYDYFIITSKNIVTIRKSKVLTNIEYNTDEKIIFNSIKPDITVIDLENNKITIELSFIRLTYEEIQDIKRILSA